MTDTEGNHDLYGLDASNASRRGLRLGMRLVLATRQNVLYSLSIRR